MGFIVADSGSSKTDWQFVGGKETKRVQTIGFNPYYFEGADLQETMRSELNGAFENLDIENIYFYGAGCSNSSKKREVRNAILSVFPGVNNVEVEHDLLGAARACCGNNEGIAAILGTGSNSCHYDGKEIVKNVTALGIMLGDEGSGAYMGKALIASYFYGDLPSNIKIKLENEYDLSIETVLNKVYHGSFPNKYLASFSLFLGENQEDAYLRNLIKGCIKSFFEKHICKYKNHTKMDLNLVGSIAHVYSPILKEVATEYNVHINRLIKSPLDELINYHQNQQKITFVES